MEGNVATGEDSPPELPLDMKVLRVTNKHGHQIIVPAIHIGFMEPRKFVQYKPPPSSCFEYHHDCLTAANYESEEEWINRMLYIQDDLHWLLKLPHHRFWSQVIHDDELQLCLESYLSQSPRNHDMSSKMKDEWIPVLKDVHRLVFLAFLRMSTYKESQINYITPTSFGDMLYDHFVFDIPKIMDLCAIYGQENAMLLRKMITNVFNTQSKYMRDLEKAVPCIIKFLSEAEIVLRSNITYEAVNDCIQSCMQNNDKEHSALLHLLMDTAVSITDVCGTLSSFLNLYPPACNAFHKYGTAIQIARFYHTVFSTLDYQYEIRKHQNQLELILMKLKHQVTMAKEFTLKVFRHVVVICCIQPIMEDESNGSFDEPRPWRECLDELVHIFKTVSSESYFIYDYSQLFPIETDLSLLSSVCPKKSLKQLKKVSYAIKRKLNIFKNASDSDASCSLISYSQVQLKCPSENTTAVITDVQNVLLPGFLQKLCHSEGRPCVHYGDDIVCDSTDVFPQVNISEVETEVELSWKINPSFHELSISQLCSNERLTNEKVKGRV